jgi:hypothetical protein
LLASPLEAQPPRRSLSVNLSNSGWSRTLSSNTSAEGSSQNLCPPTTPQHPGPDVRLRPDSVAARRRNSLTGAAPAQRRSSMGSTGASPGSPTFPAVAHRRSSMGSAGLGSPQLHHGLALTTYRRNSMNGDLMRTASSRSVMSISSGFTVHSAPAHLSRGPTMSSSLRVAAHHQQVLPAAPLPVLRPPPPTHLHQKSHRRSSCGAGPFPDCARSTSHSQDPRLLDDRNNDVFFTTSAFGPSSASGADRFRCSKTTTAVVTTRRASLF